jgi:class 3 adenylate cyclase/tetratricopeptide (TPR) repeat protein
MNPAGQRFCGSCGHALTASPQAPAPAAVPLAERRLCSVLFCDLVGFTPLSEARDPEEVRELLSRYFEAARTVIGRYGGVVEKFIGDAVMAVWGAPIATEGDTERAVRAALDLVDAVAALGVAVGVPSLAARAGVVTGEVAVTIGASHEGMVAGDAVNTAARVQSAAGPRSVLVDDVTRRLAQAAVGFEDAGEHDLKGKSEPLRLWRAVRVLSGVGGSQRVDGLEAPLTGRDAELRTIKELFHATVDRQQPRLVVVSGPAGIGKSRLGWEFEKYIDGLADLVRWHRGRCLSYGDGVAFWALAEIVRQRLGVADEDSVELATTKLVDTVLRFVPDGAEQEYVGIRLGRLLGLAYPGDSGHELARDELFAGWRLFFERLAAESPVVLLVEDSQFADAGLLEFLDYLVDWAREVSIFVLVFSRPELQRARAGWSTGRNRSILALDPLDAGSMSALLDALVPGMPTAAAASIADQAQGIPLFAVETIRSLIDRDVVVPHGGVYQMVADIGTLTVPDSLHGLLAARLDALDPGVRGLVADAAVLGTTFPLDALVAVSGRPDDEVRSGLEDLIRREVLEVSADPLSPQRGTFRFAHEMLRQVAYETLSRRDRKAHHLAVAAHLRTSFPGDGEEVVAVMARHYLDAVTAVPDDPDTQEIRGLAVAALIRAAQRATRTGAPAQAAVNYAAAAELTAEPPGPDTALAAAALWEQAAIAAVTCADLPGAIEHAARAGAGYREHSDARGEARAQVTAGRAMRIAGRHSEAREQLTAALDVLREEPDTDTVRAMAQLASVETFSGSPDADALTTSALTLGEALDVDAELLAGLFTSRGIWLAFARRRKEAGAYYREAVRLAEQIGDSNASGRALLNLSDVLTLDDPAGAVVAARSAVSHLRHTGDTDSLTFAITNLAAALLATGDWAAAADALTEGTDGDGQDREFLTLYQALVAALHGDTELATALLSGLASLRASEDPQEQAQLALVDAFTAAAAEQPAEALRHARLALSHADALGISAESPRWAWPLAARLAYQLHDPDATGELLTMLDAYPPGQLAPMLRAERDLTRARVAAANHDPDATERFVAAIANLRDHSTPYHLGHGLLDAAKQLTDNGQPDEAIALIDEAQMVGERLAARPLIGRAESLRAGIDNSRLPSA